jgi:hypothetical protein
VYQAAKRSTHCSDATSSGLCVGHHRRDLREHRLSRELGRLDYEHGIAVDRTCVHVAPWVLRDGHALAGDGRLVRRRRSPRGPFHRLRSARLPGPRRDHRSAPLRARSPSRRSPRITRGFWSAERSERLHCLASAPHAPALERRARPRTGRSRSPPRATRRSRARPPRRSPLAGSCRAAADGPRKAPSGSTSQSPARIERQYAIRAASGGPSATPSPSEPRAAITLPASPA